MQTGSDASTGARGRLGRLASPRKSPGVPAVPPSGQAGNPPVRPWENGNVIHRSEGAAVDIVRKASSKGQGIGPFNVVLLEHAEAIVAGAEGAGLPVILQISQNCVAYHGAFEPIGLSSLSLARRAAVPVAVHLDHAEDVDLVHEAVAVGVYSVMYASSRLPDDENVATTHAVVEYCHERGVVVEAELGEVGGKDGVHDPGVRTDPAEAAAFVAAATSRSPTVHLGRPRGGRLRGGADPSAPCERLMARVAPRSGMTRR